MLGSNDVEPFGRVQARLAAVIEQTIIVRLDPDYGVFLPPREVRGGVVVVMTQANNHDLRRSLISCLPMP